MPSVQITIVYCDRDLCTNFGIILLKTDLQPTFYFSANPKGKGKSIAIGQKFRNCLKSLFLSLFDDEKKIFELRQCEWSVCPL